jgi:hypothetical protein
LESVGCGYEELFWGSVRRKAGGEAETEVRRVRQALRWNRRGLWVG